MTNQEILKTEIKKAVEDGSCELLWGIILENLFGVSRESIEESIKNSSHQILEKSDLDDGGNQLENQSKIINNLSNSSITKSLAKSLNTADDNWQKQYLFLSFLGNFAKIEDRLKKPKNELKNCRNKSWLTLSFETSDGLERQLLEETINPHFTYHFVSAQQLRQEVHQEDSESNIPRPNIPKSNTLNTGSKKIIRLKIKCQSSSLLMGGIFFVIKSYLENFVIDLEGGRSFEISDLKDRVMDFYAQAVDSFKVDYLPNIHTKKFLESGRMDGISSFLDEIVFKLKDQINLIK